MKIFHLFASIGFIMAMSTGLVAPFEAAAEPHTCRIKADRGDVYVAVRDMDRSGNVISGTIWRGWINQGQSVTIECSEGTIRYSFKARSDYRGSGNNESMCTRGNIIRLP